MSLDDIKQEVMENIEVTKDSMLEDINFVTGEMTKSFDSKLINKLGELKTEVTKQLSEFVFINNTLQAKVNMLEFEIEERVAKEVNKIISSKTTLEWLLLIFNRKKADK